MKKPKKNHTLRENDKIHKNYKMWKNPKTIELIWQNSLPSRWPNSMHYRSWWGFWSDYIEHKMWIMKSKVILSWCVFFTKNLCWNSGQGCLWLCAKPGKWTFSKLFYCPCVTKLLVRQLAHLLDIFTNHKSPYSPLYRCVLQILWPFFELGFQAQYSVKVQSDSIQ